MNTTKLHVLATSLKAELNRTNIVPLLQKAVQALENQVKQPQQANHQQQLSNTLAKIYNQLGSSPVDAYSPAWRSAMEDIGVLDEFGEKLTRRLEAIFESNKVTPQTALEDLVKVHEAISETQNNLGELINGLEYFGVGEDALEEDECEVGVIVPRGYVDDNLRQFGQELVYLEKTLLVFSELVTGERTPLQIRNISSSHLSVFLNYAPEIGVCIALAIERIVALYKQLLEIKKLKSELSKNEVPDDKLSGIDDYAGEMVKPKLEELAQELIAEYGDHITDSRKNEISIELRHSLRAYP